MLKVVGCIAREHDPRLVLLGVVVCALACFTALGLIARARACSRRVRWAWLAAAAIVFGFGVWTLHFVAMLAFRPGVPIAHDLATTLASVAVASAGAALALVAWTLPRSRRVGVWAGGALLGLSVGAMHYVGVAAMRLPGDFVVAVPGVAASVLAGVGSAVPALARADAMRSYARRVEVAGWLVLSVCGVHFAGMASLTFVPGPAAPAHGAVFGSGPLALAVGSVGLALLLLCLAALAVERRLSQRAGEIARLQRLASVARDGLLIQSGGVIVEANDALCLLLGTGPDGAIGRHLSEFIPPESLAAVADRVDCTEDGLPAVEIEMRGAGGAVIPVEVFCRPIEYRGRPARAVAVRDLSARKRVEAEMWHLAHHDALTGLPNRVLLRERLAHALEAAARAGHPVAVLCLDLDGFKAVNDTLGHAAGDALLVQVAGRLLAELHPADTAARTGGDEFVVILPRTERARAEALARRMVDALARPFASGERRVEIGASAGIALFPGDGLDRAALLRAADIALYCAKRDRRGSVRAFAPEMDERLRRRRALEHDLRHAVERGEMEVHYQPLVNVGSGEVEGFEALLHWRHPERGMVPPAEFIASAEESGLIAELGRWVLGRACAEAAGWPAPLRVAVNLSPVQLRDVGLEREVADALARAGLAPGRLDVEVTEGVLIEDAARAGAVLSALRGLGVRVVLDDFGTGYSSLGYLRSFAFDALKIDRSFVGGLGRDEEAAVIVRAIIGLGHNLNLLVTAEGVETRGQLDALRAMGCDHAQGYLLGRPAPRPGFGPSAAPAGSAAPRASHAPTDAATPDAARRAEAAPSRRACGALIGAR